MEGLQLGKLQHQPPFPRSAFVIFSQNLALVKHKTKIENPPTKGHSLEKGGCADAFAPNSRSTRHGRADWFEDEGSFHFRAAFCVKRLAAPLTPVSTIFCVKIQLLSSKQPASHWAACQILTPPNTTQNAESSPQLYMKSVYEGHDPDQPDSVPQNTQRSTVGATLVFLAGTQFCLYQVSWFRS